MQSTYGLYTSGTFWGGTAYAMVWHLTSPSLCHGLPFWGYLLWLWRFFCPPSANLHSKGSVGAAQTGRENQIMLGGLHPVTCQKDRSPFELFCISFHLPLHLYISPSLPSLPPWPPMELLDRIPDTLTIDKIPKSQCWQALPTLVYAGSSWKSIAGYCWNNNHSNRWWLLCQPNLISRRCSQHVIPLFYFYSNLLFIWNLIPFSTSQPSGQMYHGALLFEWKSRLIIAAVSGLTTR